MNSTNSKLQPSELDALRQIFDAIVETVRAGGYEGAPGGILYATLMQYGCSLDQFETIMRTLVRIGRLSKRGQLYFLGVQS